MYKRTQLLTSYYFNLSRPVVLKLQHYQNHLQSFLKNDLIYLFVAVLGLHCCTGFSLVAARGGYPGFSLQRLLLLQSTGLVVGAQRLSCSVARGLWVFPYRNFLANPITSTVLNTRETKIKQIPSMQRSCVEGDNRIPLRSAMLRSARVCQNDQTYVHYS